MMDTIVPGVQNRVLSPDGNWVVGSQFTEYPVCWSAGAGSPVRFPCPGRPVAWAPDSHAVAVLWKVAGSNGPPALPGRHDPLERERQNWPGTKWVISVCTPRGEVTSRAALRESQGWAEGSLQFVIGWTADSSEILLLAWRPPVQGTPAREERGYFRTGSSAMAIAAGVRPPEQTIRPHDRWRLVALSAATTEERLIAEGTMQTGFGVPKATLFSPDGSLLAVVSQCALPAGETWALHNALRLVDLRDPQGSRALDYPGEMVGACWAPDGSGLLVRTQDSGIVKCSLAGKCTPVPLASGGDPSGWDLAVCHGQLSRLRIGADGRYLVAEDTGWVAQPSGPPRGSRSLAGSLSPDGRWLARIFEPGWSTHMGGIRVVRPGSSPPRLDLVALPSNALAKGPDMGEPPDVRDVEWSVDSRLAVCPLLTQMQRDTGLMASAIVWVAGPAPYYEVHSVYQKTEGMQFMRERGPQR